MPVTSYSRTPANNNSAAPNGWPEGMSPGSVNNSARQLMTDIVNEASKNTAKVLVSVAGTNTITAGMSPALDAYVAGMIVVFTPANSNTAAATLNIDSLGALDIQKLNGAALCAGDLVAGTPAVLVLDSGADDWILLNPVGSGTFTGTLTGYAVNPTGTFTYLVINKMAVIYGPNVNVSGTSNASTMTMTGLPAAVQPAAGNWYFSCVVRNNGVDVIGLGSVFGSTITFYAGAPSSSFTSSGTKGLPQGFVASYPLA